MPSISAGDKVLVTGANGYIAIWIVQKLLEKGYRVRAAVRTTSKGQHLQEYFKSYGDKLEMVYVPDIEKVEFLDVGGTYAHQVSMIRREPLTTLQRTSALFSTPPRRQI